MSRLVTLVKVSPPASLIVPKLLAAAGEGNPKLLPFKSNVPAATVRASVVTLPVNCLVAPLSLIIKSSTAFPKKLYVCVPEPTLEKVIVPVPLVQVMVPTGSVITTFPLKIKLGLFVPLSNVPVPAEPAPFNSTLPLKVTVPEPNLQ